MLDQDSDVLSLSSQSSNEGISRGVSFKSSATNKTALSASDTEESELAQHETKLVKRSKCLVFFVLLAAAAGCGAGKLLMSFD